MNWCILNVANTEEKDTRITKHWVWHSMCRGAGQEGEEQYYKEGTTKLIALVNLCVRIINECQMAWVLVARGEENMWGVWASTNIDQT